MQNAREFVLPPGVRYVKAIETRPRGIEKFRWLLVPEFSTDCSIALLEVYFFHSILSLFLSFHFDSEKLLK